MTKDIDKKFVIGDITIIYTIPDVGGLPTNFLSFMEWSGHRYFDASLHGVWAIA